MTECQICYDISLDERYNADYFAGWRAAMKFAHHVHAEEKYNGFTSANGVLGAGPDSVIVDGDWLQARLDDLEDYKRCGDL